MTRPYHYLKPARSVGFPRRQIALAVNWERVERPHQPGRADDILSGWTAQEWSGGPGGEKWEASGEGMDAQSFWLWLEARLQRRTSTWVWCLGMAHGLTLLGFWRLITTGEWTLAAQDCQAETDDGGCTIGRQPAIVVVNDPPTIVVAHRPGRSGTVRLLDSRNLGVESWLDMGAATGDCRALAGWLQGWCRAVDHLRLGGLRHTAAAQAWNGWRCSYLECGVLVHGDAEVSRLERASVHPGRAEAYRLGVVGGTIHQYDASAFYPGCSVSGPLPVRLRWSGACSLADVRGAVSRGWLALCHCRVRTDRALLPRRERGRTIWPVGAWEVTLPYPEIEYARAAGAEVSVVWAALYEPGRPVDMLVSVLWAFRLRCQRQGLTAEATCAKLVANSLVGKWAAHGRVWTHEPGVIPPQDWYTWHRPYGPHGELHRYRSIGWHVQREDVSDETPESVPALAAWTYSVGRVRLMGWIDVATWEDTIYVDSDSLFCVGRAGARLAAAGLVRPGELGALRLQGVHDGIRIGGIRDYTASGRVVQAGTPSAERRRRDGVYEWWRAATVAECVAGRCAPEAVARLVTVPVTRAYRHGLVRGDGRVEPIRVND